MKQLYDVDAACDITDRIVVIPDQELNRVVNKTLDGQYYVQIIGSAAQKMNIEIIVDFAGKGLINTAEASGNLLQASYDGGTIQGRIIARNDWARLGAGFYRTTITLGVVTS